MIVPSTYEELAGLIENEDKLVLFFTADWCPDCQFIYPVMPDIEVEHTNMTFVRVNRDQFIEVAQKWDIFGIPSFVVIEKGQEVGRLVNKMRKTKTEIMHFLAAYQ
ncbi:thioredoxin family protein [Streptococcus dysgalactiae]|uniref:thioredoxin family protein n=1 Tax=Streptococcus dysgalactiae TaxID=1334 RepID=UPI000806F280|nr:thioredoxin family protein [Streptococcus dysgalactiae]OBZ03924.1 thiol reductase thioredoxin [Streptococcus dysgalactiae subsp. equisimilis]